MSETTAAEKVLENALAPKVAEVDGRKVEQHDIDDQILAARFAASCAAAHGRGLGVRISKFKAGGAQ